MNKVSKSNTIRILDDIAEEIGEGVFDLSFQLELDNGSTIIDADRFDLSASIDEKNIITFKGNCGSVFVKWEFKPCNDGYRIRLDVTGDKPLGCTRIKSLI